MSNQAKPEFYIRTAGDNLVVEEKNPPAGQTFSPRHIICAGHTCRCHQGNDGRVLTVYLGEWWKIADREAFARELVSQHLPTGSWNDGEKAALAQKLQGILQLDPPASISI